MPVRYDIFECDEVQFQTRRRVRRLVGVVLAAAVLTTGLATVLYRREMVPAWLLGAVYSSHGKAWPSAPSCGGGGCGARRGA
jgi:hypothetical protein